MKTRIDNAESQLKAKAEELKRLVDSTINAIYIPMPIEKRQTQPQSVPSNKGTYVAIAMGVVMLFCGILTHKGEDTNHTQNVGTDGVKKESSNVSSTLLSLAGLAVAGVGAYRLLKSKSSRQLNNVESVSVDYEKLSFEVTNAVLDVKDKISNSWDNTVFALTQRLKKDAEELAADRADSIIEHIISSSHIEWPALEMRNKIQSAFDTNDVAQIQQCLKEVKQQLYASVDTACNKQIEIYQGSL